MLTSRFRCSLRYAPGDLRAVDRRGLGLPRAESAVLRRVDRDGYANSRLISPVSIQLDDYAARVDPVDCFTRRTSHGSNVLVAQSVEPHKGAFPARDFGYKIVDFPTSSADQAVLTGEGDNRTRTFRCRDVKLPLPQTFKIQSVDVYTPVAMRCLDNVVE